MMIAQECESYLEHRRRGRSSSYSNSGGESVSEELEPNDGCKKTGVKFRTGVVTINDHLNHDEPTNVSSFSPRHTRTAESAQSRTFCATKGFVSKTEVVSLSYRQKQRQPRFVLITQIWQITKEKKIQGEMTWSKQSVEEERKTYLRCVQHFIHSC